MIICAVILAVLRRLALIGLAGYLMTATLCPLPGTSQCVRIGSFLRSHQKLDARASSWEFRGSFEYSYRYSPLFAVREVPFVALGLTICALHCVLCSSRASVLITIIAWRA